MVNCVRLECLGRPLGQAAFGGVGRRELRRSGNAGQGTLPSAGCCGGYWMAFAVVLPPLCMIWADTRSPTRIAPMLCARPVILVWLVTAAVIEGPSPAIVIDVGLTAVTWPVRKNCVTTPLPPPWPGATPLAEPPGAPPPGALPPGATPPGAT